MAGPFCSQCGEKKLSAEDYSIRSVLHEVAEDFAHLDSKILRTLKALITKPGLLSNAYFAGGRSRYTKPLTLFVILNLVFFVVQPHTQLLSYKYSQYTSIESPGSARRRELVREKLVATGEKEQSYVIRFNDRLQEQKKSMLIFSVPALALAMLLVYGWKKRYYVEHLVFSIHVYAFLLIALMTTAVLFYLLYQVLTALFGRSGGALMEHIGTDTGLSVILGTGLYTYIFFGLRRAYLDSRLGAGLRAAAITLVVLILTGYYHDFLFYVTYFTT
jgi:hypothetical protein